MNEGPLKISAIKGTRADYNEMVLHLNDFKRQS
ncbi:MAG: hypothetical protein ACFWUG_18225 [Rahnella inusitata]|jgi:hypothetical protein